MCQTCGWEELLTLIDELLGSGEYDWAEDTLDGIASWVADKKHCTDKQYSAVKNIERSRR